VKVEDTWERRRKEKGGNGGILRWKNDDDRLS
jgi:hypothetical protein